MIKDSEADYPMILDGASGSISKLEVEHCVSKNFRSAHHTTCKNIVNCVILNLFVNHKQKPSPSTTEPIVKYIKRNNSAFYTSVQSMFKPIDEKFMQYARKVTDEADELFTKMRTANFVVYIISLDIANSGLFNYQEILTRTYPYRTLLRF